MLKSDWNATQFFEELVAKNKLAVGEGFTFCKISGLGGLRGSPGADADGIRFCVRQRHRRRLHGTQ